MSKSEKSVSVSLDFIYTISILFLKTTNTTKNKYTKYLLTR